MNLPIKISASFLVFLSLVLSFPAIGRAQYVDVAQSVKEYVADPIAYAVANQIIKKVTAQTVNWINSGFKGNPAYVTDPGQFFLDVGDAEASRFLSSAGMQNICAPFKAQVRLALVKNYINDKENYSCTLSKLKNNYDQFTNDFSAGRWDGWFEVTQNDSNNPYGAYLQAQSSLFAQIGAENNKYVKQLEQGRGFLSFEKCPEGKELDPKAGTGDCQVAKEVVTPGSVIQSKLDTALNSGASRLEMADEIDEIIGSLATTLINKALNGVRNLSKKSATGSSFTSDLSNDPMLKPTNPNAGNVTGGDINCTSSGGSSSETVDPVTGELTSSGSTGGSAGCNSTPVEAPPIVLPDESLATIGGGDPGGPVIDPPADALSKHPNQVAVVAQAKANVLAKGPIPPGNCGALSIVREAVRLIGGDAGLLDKPAGENCQGFASDIIVFKDGYIFDTLASGGEKNDPAWMPQPCIETGFTPICPGRWRAGI